jgi:hypothetical protein
MGGWFHRHAERTTNKKRMMQLHGKIIRYVSERVGDEEIVLGRGGSISLHDGYLIVLSSQEIIFRSCTEDTQISYLMSGDGVLIHGKNLEQDGRDQTITAYFVDYIK